MVKRMHGKGKRALPAVGGASGVRLMGTCDPLGGSPNGNAKRCPLNAELVYECKYDEGWEGIVKAVCRLDNQFEVTEKCAQVKCDGSNVPTPRHAKLAEYMNRGGAMVSKTDNPYAYCGLRRHRCARQDGPRHDGPRGVALDRVGAVLAFDCVRCALAALWALHESQKDVAVHRAEGPGGSVASDRACVSAGRLTALWWRFGGRYLSVIAFKCDPGYHSNVDMVCFHHGEWRTDDECTENVCIPGSGLRCLWGSLWSFWGSSGLPPGLPLGPLGRSQRSS